MCPAWLPDDFFVHPHALERYRQHAPGADYAGLRDAVRAAQAVSPELVAAATRNPRRAADTRNLYFFTEPQPDFGGLFVWVSSSTRNPHTCSGMIQTYLRLIPDQIAILRPAPVLAHPTGCCCSTCV